LFRYLKEKDADGEGELGKRETKGRASGRGMRCPIIIDKAARQPPMSEAWAKKNLALNSTMNKVVVAGVHETFESKTRRRGQGKNLD